jgi:hypothetical protein
LKMNTALYWKIWTELCIVLNYIQQILCFGFRFKNVIENINQNWLTAVFHGMDDSKLYWSLSTLTGYGFYSACPEARII